MLPDEDYQPPGCRDREEVQDDRLQRQDQRPERAGQQQERQARDERDQERKVAVDEVQEVGALCRLTAGRDVARQRLRGRVDAVERRAARG